MSICLSYTYSWSQPRNGSIDLFVTGMGDAQRIHFECSDGSVKWFVRSTSDSIPNQQPKRDLDAWFWLVTGVGRWSLRPCWVGFAAV